MGRHRFSVTLSRHSYSDIADFMDAAVEADGAVIAVTFSSEKTAIHKLYRMNTWRMYNREAGIFKYDAFVFRRKDNKVFIEPRGGLEAVEITKNGEPFDPRPKPRIPSNPRFLELIQENMDGKISAEQYIQEMNKIRTAEGIPLLTSEEMDRARENNPVNKHIRLTGEAESARIKADDLAQVEARRGKPLELDRSDD